MKSIILLISFLSFLFISCNNCPSVYTYQPPEFINNGLEIGTLEQVGMDSFLVSKAIDCIYANKYDQVHSILIYKDGLLVFEEYFEGNDFKWDGPDHYGERIQWDKNSMHVIMSCSKSIASASIGIAVDHGYIKSVDESIFNYLPDHQQFKTNGKEMITIKHLLTMTSGLKWDEWKSHGTSANDIDRIYFECSDDPVKCVLEKELLNTPGEKFTYNGGGTIILGEILKHATKMNIGDFSKKYLFTPLGIDSVYWYQFKNGTYACDGSIKMTSQDMLKFGITYLNEGKWNNESIVSNDWVTKSKSTYKNNTGINIPIDDSGRNGYAYSWWTNEISISGEKVNLFQAGGWGGQEIIIFPDDNMVVVFTGGNYVVKKHIYKILKRFILPAIK
ncbi:MAG: serine hydrolase [Bacteroidetes bacterium]|nr:serine hydrolase [Bacteroidota bacterium]MBL6944317.1 serine hydrolase [Bacteroidales bacterium]